jgi:dihydrofolate synthase/folylpolyglutamate synthase
MSKIKSITELEKWLDAYLNFEKLPQKNIFWLDTIQFLCSKFGNPQNCAPSVHIAGSKGKGSVSAMTSSILEEAGYSVGLYMSPHILDFVERVGTAHNTFPSSVYDRAVQELQEGISLISPNDLPGGRALTWFELVTLFAFLCFRTAKVDWGVYEVGLGGRLDATNVLLPTVCAIGPIELEHTQYLGNTVEKIAGEKAGIIKDRVPVVIATQKPSVKNVFIAVAKKHKAPIKFVDDLLAAYTFSYSSKSGDNRYKMNIHLESNLFRVPIDTYLQLLGEFQVQNAALAAFAVKTIFPDMDEQIIARGLSRAFLPGRFEMLPHPGKFYGITELVLDGAHTVNSVRYTMRTFSTLFTSKNAHLLFGCAADKDAEDIASCFKGYFSRITLTRPGSIKQSDMERMKLAFSTAGLHFAAYDDYTFAICRAMEDASTESVPLLVTGSFYLIAEVKKFLAVQR